EHELVISHGNGPQVGLLALQGSAYTEVETYPLDLLGAQTEGMIGYLIQQELGNELPFEKRVTSLLTLIEVDRGDPAFDDPATPGRKLVGVEAVIDKDLASALLAKDLEADALVIATDVDAVYADWGTPDQRAIRRATPAALDGTEFAAGSMGPKVRAASW